MPSHRVHCWISNLLLGDEFDVLHQIMDAPAARLGFKHRSALHSPEEVLLLSLLSLRPIETFEAGILHIVLDKACSSIKKRKVL